MRCFLDDRDSEPMAHSDDVLVPDLAVRFRIFLEGEIVDSPLAEKLWQNFGRLTTDHEKPRVEFAEALVQIFQTLE